MRALTECLTPGYLIFNKRKSEILTSRNRNQPVDETDWITDDEDSEFPTKKEKRMAVIKEVHKIAKKDRKKRGNSPFDPIDVEMNVPDLRKKADANIPRKEFTEFEGIAIKS